MANFPPSPPPLPRFLRLQPELIPSIVVAGSFTAAALAGQIIATGTLASLTVGQGIGAGAGAVIAVGAGVGLDQGQVQGFNAGAGQITAFGNTVGLGTSDATVPVVPSAIAPFAPAFSELGLDAWERLGMAAGDLTVAHLNSMRRSMNLVLVRWANNGLNLWEITNAQIPLVAGQATYVLPTPLIEMLDTYVSAGVAPNVRDLVVTAMSRNTYAAIPNKLQSGRPILYWFDRTITPSVTVWPVPTRTDTYTLNYFGWSQVQDADPASGNTGNMPYRFLEAFTAGVASHLAMKWAPSRAQALKAYSDEVFVEAADEDRELVTLSMVPDFGAYFR